MVCRLFVAVRGLLSSCGMQAPERVGSVVQHAGSLVVACRLSSCDMWP